jgi:hypothetical protein
MNARRSKCSAWVAPAFGALALVATAPAFYIVEGTPKARQP